MRPTRRPAGPWRATRAVLGLRVRRLLNHSPNIGRKKDGRSGTSRRSGGSGPWLLAIVAFYLLVGFAMLRPPLAVVMAHFPGAALPRAAAVLLCAVLVAILSMDLVAGWRSTGKIEADVEWLLSFPSPVWVLLTGKVAERALLSFGWPLIYPFVTYLAWMGGARWWSFAAALPLTALLLLLTAMGGLAMELLVRRTLPGLLLKWLPGVFMVGGGGGLLLVLSSSTIELADAPARWLRLGASLPYVPFEGLIRLASGPGPAPARLLGFAAEAATVSGLTLGLIRWLTVRGIEPGRGGPEGRRGASAASGRGRLGLVQKELLSVLRTPARLFTMLLPLLFLVGSSRLSEVEDASMVQINFILPLMAVGFVALSTVSLMVHEGPSVWLMFCVPQSLEQIVFRKIAFHLVVAVGAAALLLVATWLAVSPSWTAVGLSAYVLVAVALLSALGGCLGVLGSDPLSSEPARRLQGGAVFLPMLVLYILVGGLVVPGLWTKVVLLVMAAALLVALIQRVRRYLPFLLDPTAAPSPQVQASDGLTAALFFFILQAAGFAGATALEVSPWTAAGYAFAGAGALVAVGVGTMILRRPLRGSDVGWAMPRGAGRTLLEAFGWAAAAVVVALSYTLLAAQWPWLSEQLQANGVLPAPEASDLPAVVLLVCAAAPIFEELIFRGVLQSGLRTSLSPGPAMLGASLVFAAVHPPAAAPPVFLMSLCAACAFERTRSLLAPILVHAAYNGAVLGLQ
ncbi:MAG: CPBP family intramembrane glutamic endopeptidase [Myxococcota bacterium]